MSDYIILAGSAITKIPQIMQILRHADARGLSLSMFGSEAITQLASVAFYRSQSIPFVAYGENLFLGIQNTIICALCVKHQKLRLRDTFLFSTKKKTNPLWMVLALAVAFAAKRVGWLRLLHGLGFPLAMATRLQQILDNWRHGNTGQLSAIPFALGLVGSLFRIRTALQQLNNRIALFGFIASVMVNAALVAQILYMNHRAVGQSTETADE